MLRSCVRACVHVCVHAYVCMCLSVALVRCVRFLILFYGHVERDLVGYECSWRHQLIDFLMRETQMDLDDVFILIGAFLYA